MKIYLQRFQYASCLPVFVRGLAQDLLHIGFYIFQFFQLLFTF